MSKARNLSDLLDANGDVVSGSLDNVPPADVVNDTTPQLGGNLDLNGSDITGTGNVNVTGTITATNFVGSDLVNDTTPQLGGALDTNGNNINFGDNVKAQFGASSDLQIYHDGSNSWIDDQGTGSLVLTTNGSAIVLQNGTSETMIKANVNGESALYYDNSKKLATTSTGVSVTGTVAATSFSGDGSNLTGLPGGGGSFYRMATGSYSSQGGSYVTLSFTNADTSKPIWIDVNMPNNVYLVLTANNASNGSFASNVGYGSNVSDTSSGSASFNFASNPSTTSSISGITSGQRVGFWPTSSTCSFRFTRTAGDNGATAYFSVHH